jgi:hypothetical protein
MFGYIGGEQLYHRENIGTKEIEGNMIKGIKDRPCEHT